MMLNSISDDDEKAYTAMPARMYILDAFGAVTWKCGLEPHPFDLLGFEEKIKDLSSNKCAPKQFQQTFETQIC